MENKVYWYNCEKYDEKLITEGYQEILVDNGLLDFVTSGMKIGIKVNLVGNFGPDKAATTHPLLVKKLCELLIERGAIVTIGDSPGGLFTESILKSIYKGTGFLICEEIGAKLNYDVSTSQLKVEKQVVKTLDVSNWLLEQDALINFAKLKSHGMMALSASVKNTTFTNFSGGQTVRDYASLRKQNKSRMLAVVVLALCVVLSASMLFSRLMVYSPANECQYIPLTKSNGITHVTRSDRTSIAKVNPRMLYARPLLLAAAGFEA